MAETEELGSFTEYSEDISTAEAPPALPAREYDAEIKKAIRKKSQRDTMYAEVHFFISPDQYPADFIGGDPDGTTIIYRRLSLEDKPQARFSVRRFCESVGAPMGKRIDVNDWIGLRGKVKVIIEKWEGQDRNQVQAVTRA